SLCIGCCIDPAFPLHRFLSNYLHRKWELSTPMPPQLPRVLPRVTPAGQRRIVEFPPRLSSGYLVRDAHRAFQRLLERRIAAYGVTRGQWYFLRALWNADGLSQRELSARVGMMEPTTVIALRSMDRSGLIRRVRGDDDRRKVRVFLT